ncbi:7-deoxyloganetic acid glucosyl transferase-like [Salvia miltiorrhiza]|uniref:7-deoxyloganetic acid glucosyl transferase-like n=1 Tax=Salvia miltiorrhiza TaxID=226208 RepID=UPI0025AC045A|nr:7-deoxyloganetic acid glucosyl transferase-like [Salvia miltiorrhiza]
MDQTPAPARVVMFPLPLQGPVNSMLKLAELLCIGGLQITFLVTDDIHARLHRHSNIQTRFQSYPGFQIRSIPDGLPENHPRGAKFMELFESLRTKTKPLLKEFLQSGGGGPISCVIADAVLGFACDVADDVGIPIFHVRTISAACLWVFFSLPMLIQSGDLPFKGDDDLDVPIKSVPGMERYLRRRDLPSFCRSGDIADPHIEMYKMEATENPRASGLILNTFEELEAPILSKMRNVCPNIYTIGPLHAHLKAKLAATASSLPAFSNSLWEEDRSCVAWLNSQPPKSVLYVSFGSLATVTRDQLMEFWYGLVNSGQRFLWVMRPDSVDGKDWESRIPVELSQGTKERGYVVGWAPQEEVLAHPAVGGFLTHSGWNSTLESVYEGVPMICWPYFLDQQVNSRLVEEEWKLGLDMKDSCDRSVIEESVRNLMEVRKEEFLRRADEMAKSAKASLSEGGSSYSHLDRLIQDIKTKSAQVVRD